METARRLDSTTGTKIGDMDFMTTACLSVQHDARYAATVEVMMQNTVAMTRKRVMDVLVDAEMRHKMVAGMTSAPLLQMAMSASGRRGTTSSKSSRYKGERKGNCHSAANLDTGHASANRRT